MSVDAASPLVTAVLPKHPYPGLRPFEPDEWLIFFGRERMIDEVIERLAEQRLVLIHGASGSGKSSLVRAGVLPKLARQHLGHGTAWLTCAMRPSGGPLWNLARELARFEGRDGDVARVNEISRMFNRRGATLASVIGQLEGLAAKRLCILVDQFEELFRFAKETSHEEAELFVDLLTRTIAPADESETSAPAPVADVHVVVTMRSEFLGDCARFEGLAEAINRTQYLVPRMDRDGLTRAIRRPAQLYGGDVSADLAERLIAAARGSEDELPLIQHGLMMIWDHAAQATSPGKKITPDASLIDAAGSLAAMLSNHADKVMAEAAPDKMGELTVERLFRALTDVNVEGQAIRRPQAFADLVKVTGATPDTLRKIIEAFRAEGVSFLTPYAPVPIEDATVIDISHEALIRSWRKVADPTAGWLKKEFDDGLIWRSLSVDAKFFETNPKHTLPPASLDVRQDWLKHQTEPWSQRHGGNWKLVEGLVAASAKAREKARWLTTGFMAVLGLVAVGAGLFGYIATTERNEALRAQAEAQQAQLAADGAQKRTKAEGEDAADVARVARNNYSATNLELRNRLDDLLDWMSPARQSAVYGSQAEASSNAGDFAAERSELDKALRIEPALVPLLVSSSNNFVSLGDAEGAIRDAQKALHSGTTHAVVYGNLILGEAMLRDYRGAIAHIDEALRKSQTTIWDTESLLAPEVKEVTKGFQLEVRDTDFLLALRYLKAALLAMSGDGRFSAALDEADRIDPDRPFSRVAYLTALNWEWLIVRGQAKRDAREADSRGLPPSRGVKLPIKDYGAFAIEGVLWLRIAETRGDFAGRAGRAFAESLAAWVEQEAKKPIESIKEENSPLGDARDKEVQAIELKNGPNSGTKAYQMAPALALLSEAIHLLDPQRLARPLGRREKDLLIDLLLRRGDWKLSSKDHGGAIQDAERVLKIDSGVADAYRLLGDALVVDDDRAAKYRKAMSLDPSNTDALSGLVTVLEKSNSQEALKHLESERKFVRFRSEEYAHLATLQDKNGKTLDALSSITIAIERTPWNLDLYAARRTCEINANKPRSVAYLHYARGLHEAAEFSARTGDDERALRAFTEAFNNMARRDKDDKYEAVKLELASLTRDFSAFLVRRFGRDDAMRWWRSFAANPLASKRERQISAQEADHLSAEK
jgi:hypothetical protein